MPAAREPYERVYVLFPPNADGEWVRAALDSGIVDRFRWTLGFSADDAGIGDGLTSRTVVAINPAAWGGDLHAFFARYYPGMIYETVVAADPTVLCARLRAWDMTPRPPIIPQRVPRISLHIQNRWSGDKSFIARVKPGAVKAFNVDDLAEFKEVSPDTLTVFRRYFSKKDQDAYIAQDPLTAARDFLSTFSHDLLRYPEQIDFAESLNEVIDGGPERVRRAVAFDVAFAQVLTDFAITNGLRVRPAVLTAAVGNPDHGAETELLLPAARAAMETEGVLCYHAYWPVAGNKGGVDFEWQHMAGRALESWDPLFLSHGVKVRYIMSEIGACQGFFTPDGKLSGVGGDGWLKDTCLDGNWGAFKAQLLHFDERLEEWNRTHEGRAIAGTIFTTCSDSSGWKTFQFREDEMTDLANALVARYWQ